MQGSQAYLSLEVAAAAASEFGLRSRLALAGPEVFSSGWDLITAAEADGFLAERLIRSSSMLMSFSDNCRRGKIAL